MTGKRHISSGSPFEAAAGYSRAVVDDDWVHVSGTTGFDYVTMTISDDVVVQTRQTLRNIETALQEAGASLDDVVRVRYLLTDAEDFKRIAPVISDAFARAKPAATMMIVGLIDPRMRIEIEATARVPTQG